MTEQNSGGRGEAGRRALEAFRASASPEELRAVSVRGAKARWAKFHAQKAEAQRKLADGAERRRQGVLNYWANMTPEERSARAKAAAANRSGRKSTKPAREAATIQMVAPVQEVVVNVTEAASPAQNRVILDAIGQNYDTGRLRYLGDYSDARIAADLGLPVEWVTPLRESLFGPGENEAQDVVSSAVDTVVQRLSDLETSFIRAIEEFDQRRKALLDDLRSTCQRIGISAPALLAA